MFTKALLLSTTIFAGLSPPSCDAARPPAASPTKYNPSSGGGGGAWDSSPKDIIDLYQHHHHHKLRRTRRNRKLQSLATDFPFDDEPSQQDPVICPNGHCYVENQGCMHITTYECKSQTTTWGGGDSILQQGSSEGDETINPRQNDNSNKCNPGQCWAEMYQSCMHILSQECRNPQPTRQPTERPTPSPTQKPTFAIEVTVHPVELTLEGVPKNYELTEDVRALILRFASEIIEMYLEEPMEFISVEFGGYLARNRDRRRLPGAVVHGQEDGLLASSSSSSSSKAKTLIRLQEQKDKQSQRNLQLGVNVIEPIVVPMKITVQGPSNMNDFALSYIMETLKAQISDLIGRLQSYDYETFKDVEVESGTYNMNDVVGETLNPTKRPTRQPISRRPTNPPTPLPTPKLEETTHPIALFFKNVPSGYRLSPENRASLIRFVKEMMEEELDRRLQLVEVNYPGVLSHDKDRRVLFELDELLEFEEEKETTFEDTIYDNNREQQRRLATHALPLLIKVRGPDTVSDFALVYVMEVFDIENTRKICQYMKTLDYETFDGTCNVYAETYSLRDLIDGTEEPTKSPTPKPTEKLVEGSHPVQLIFKSAPAGYSFSKDARASLIGFVKELLTNRLEKPLELVDVEYAGVLVQAEDVILRRRRHLQGAYAPRLPMMITVRSPPDVADFALDYILQVLREYMQDIEFYLKAVDGKVFVAPKLDVDTYDPVEISDTTELEVTTHPILFTFESAPEGYEMTPSVRNLIVKFINEEMLEGNLKPFDLIEAEYAGRLGRMLRNVQDRWLQEGPPKLPLLVSVEGPEDLSYLARPYILQAIEDNMHALQDFLKGLDGPDIGDAFLEPYVTVDIFDPNNISIKEETPPWWVQPWWVWFLVAIGGLLMICCCSLICFIQCRRRNVQKLKEVEIVEDAIVPAGPLVVEKPIIVEKPVIIEQKVRDRKHKKKHRKKKKKKKHHRQPKQMYIERQQSYQSYDDDPQILIPPDGMDMTARSGITFEMDPPSEYYILQGQDYDGSVLSGSVLPMSTAQSEHPQLTAGSEQRQTIADGESSYYTDGYSRGETTEGEMLAIEYEAASQSQYTRGSRQSRSMSRRTSQSYSKQPSMASSSHHQYAKEPSGHEWAEIRSYATEENQQYIGVQSEQSVASYATEENYASQYNDHPQFAAAEAIRYQQQMMHAATNPSFATQTPSQQQDPHMAAAVATEQQQTTMFAGFDDPSFSVEGNDSRHASNYSQSRTSSYHHPKNRRASGGVESSDDDSDVWYNARRTSL